MVVGRIHRGTSVSIGNQLMSLLIHRVIRRVKGQKAEYREKKKVEFKDMGGRAGGAVPESDIQ